MKGSERSEKSENAKFLKIRKIVTKVAKVFEKSTSRLASAFLDIRQVLAKPQPDISKAWGGMVRNGSIVEEFGQFGIAKIFQLKMKKTRKTCILMPEKRRF